jgi:uncharacterized membrane protein
MTELLVGLALWIIAHLAKRVMPGIRRDMAKALGERSTRGVIATVILVSVVLMVLGYRSMEFISVYTPFPWAGHLNNTLMFFALFAFGVGPAGGRLSARFRHPMLWGVFLWAVAHLLVNGDLASILLFGGLGLWSLVQRRLINQTEGPWERPMPGNALNDYKLLLGVLFLYALIAGIHWLFGHNPFLGAYN